MADRLSRAKLARAAATLNARAGLKGLLPPLLLMTDDERLSDPLGAARALPRRSLVIARAREPAKRQALARTLLPIVHARDLILLIADDPALAHRIGAHGLHLPEARAQDAAHWRAQAPHWLITAAAHSLAAIRRARYADAVLLSPVFATKSHADAASLGALRFRILTRSCHAPVYALGGIDARSIAQLQGARAAGIAAIGALSA